MSRRCACCRGWTRKLAERTQGAPLDRVWLVLKLNINNIMQVHKDCTGPHTPQKTECDLRKRPSPGIFQVTNW